MSDTKDAATDETTNETTDETSKESHNEPNACAPRWVPERIFLRCRAHVSHRAPDAAPDWQPTLPGTLVSLRPLAPTDLEPLYAAASDPRIWAEHPSSDRHERAPFERFFARVIASGGALATLDAASGRLIGSSCYYDWIADERSITIGYTFLAREFWGTGANREMKRLMIDHAFRWAEVVRFNVAPRNARSRAALERIGARPEGERTIEAAGGSEYRLVYAIRRHSTPRGP